MHTGIELTKSENIVQNYSVEMLKITSIKIWCADYLNQL